MLGNPRFLAAYLLCVYKGGVIKLRKEVMIFRRLFARLLLCITGGFLLAFVGAANAQTWVSQTNLPSIRFNAGGVAINGMFFVFGGNVAGSVSNSVIGYYPPNNNWVSLASLTNPRRGAAVAVTNNGTSNVVYVVGGFDGSDLIVPSTEVYNVSGNSWSTIPTIQSPVAGAVAGVINGQLYVAGGTTGGLGMINSLQKYDPTTNTWSKKSAASVQRAHGTGGVINGKLYVVAGLDPNRNLLKSLEVYDPVTDSWTMKSSMPIALDMPTSVVIGSKLYVFGGSTTSANLQTFTNYNTVYVYDVATDSWSAPVTLPSALGGMVAGVISGTVYLAGGAAIASDGSGFSAISSATISAVFGTPDSPTNVAATAGNAQVSVSFNPVQGATSYTATCVSSSGSSSATGAGSPLTVTGLINTAYQCSVSANNTIGAGATSSAVSVTPYTVAGAPTLTSATVANGQTTISFNPPVSSGGSVITGYQASCTGGGTTKTALGSASPITINGLANGTPYQCTVIAINSAGNGSSSSPINVTPATVPDVPTGIAATVGNNQAVISFYVPLNNGGSAITNYTATCASNGNTVNASSTASPLTVSGLSNGTTYLCSVVANNSVGASMASSAISVTPADPNAGADSFFNYVEDHYPQYFYGGPNHVINSQWFLSYYYRRYADGAVLTVNNGTVYVMSPGFGSALLDIGSLSTWLNTFNIAH